MKQNGLCCIFFEKGYISNNCTINYSCKKCHGKHSISLCLQKFENIESKANENNDIKNDVNVDNLSTDHSSTIVSTTAVNLSTESNNVLLQRAFAKITNEKGCHFEKVRILFDSGSQRIYSDEYVRYKSEVLVMPLICRLDLFDYYSSAFRDNKNEPVAKNSYHECFVSGSFFHII